MKNVFMLLIFLYFIDISYSANIIKNITLKNYDGLSDITIELLTEPFVLTYKINSDMDDDFIKNVTIYSNSLKENELILDASYFSRSGTLYQEFYEWNDHNKDFVLQKIINGEQKDYINEIFTIKIDGIEWFECCLSLANRENNRKYVLNNEQVRNKTIQLLNLIRKKIKSNKTDELKSLIDIYSAYELSKILDEDNVLIINDLAYYLINDGNIEASIILLERITEKFPQRVVAKLNLADAYWEAGFENHLISKSIKFYKEYIDLMTKKGIRNKIPKRVFDRVNSFEETLN